MANNPQGTGGAGPPIEHPKKSGLEAAVSAEVALQLSRTGGTGGGGDDKRLAEIESRLSIIEKTMVTKEYLQKELGDIRTDIGKVPIETLKTLAIFVGALAALATVIGVIYTVFFKH